MKKEDGADWEQSYVRLVGLTVGVDEAERLMLEYLRNTLTTKVNFKMENLFSNILRAGSAQPPRGFWNISDAMLDLVGISRTGREKQILTVLANVRNSCHANGIHNSAPLSVDIDEIQFEFLTGQPVRCSSWEHILLILRANISVLESILFSSRVSQIAGEIPDAFAAGLSSP